MLEEQVVRSKGMFPIYILTSEGQSNFSFEDQ